MSRWRLRPCVLVLVLLGCGELCRTAAAQEQKEPWEGKIVREVVPDGFHNQAWSNYRNRLSIRPGVTLTADLIDRDVRLLWGEKLFGWVNIQANPTPDDPDRVIVTVTVTEYDYVEAVEFEGVTAFPIEKLRVDRRVARGTHLNPAHLKQDKEEIRKKYLEDGYHFSTVEAVPVPADTGVILKWKITEGPRVTVHSISFTGNEGIEDGDLLDRMTMKNNSWIFGVIPSNPQPFVMKKLLNDLERIKIYYRSKGWLDILQGERVFVSDLRFNRNKTLAFVTIHVDEGPRYTVRKISFEGNDIIPDAELAGMIELKPGEFYNDGLAQVGGRTIHGAYGERAYITAEVQLRQSFPERGTELDLLYKITENKKAYIGTITFTGNEKTRDDVLRREFTRRGFVPGEEYNLKAFQLALRSIMDRGWLDPRAPNGPIRPRQDPGVIPGTRDVSVDITEGNSGNLRFAAGFSSAFGIQGMIEMTQRNFDISDLPSSVGDIFTGEAFSGGGQMGRPDGVVDRTSS